MPLISLPTLIAVSLLYSYWGDLQYGGREAGSGGSEEEEGEQTDAASGSLEANEGRKGHKPAGQKQEEATEAADDDVVHTLEVLEVLLVAQPAVTDEVLACVHAGIPWKRVRRARKCVHVMSACVGRWVGVQDV